MMDEVTSDLNVQRRKSWSDRFFKGMLCGLLIVFLIVAAGSILPALLTHRHGTDLVASSLAMKEINAAMLEFSHEYGSFPNDQTALQVSEKFPNVSGLKKPSSADDYFKQLVVTEYLDEEILRIAKKRDVKLSYVVWQEHVPTKGGAPVLLAPLVQGEQRFDLKYASAKALEARVDQSIRTHRITDEGEARAGKTHFFSEDLPWWSEQEWKLAWPE